MLFSSELQPSDRRPRRAFLVIPVTAAGAWWLIARHASHALADPAAQGAGEPVTLLLCSDGGNKNERRSLRKIVNTDAQWRAELSQEAYAVTRRAATEFAFSNRYWNERRKGLYRCVCCGTALFRSEQKFDSDTGWPSFSKPVAAENVWSREDRSLNEPRTEVLCRKCDAHLGHVFTDGPPDGLRYCLNSAALVLVP